MRRSRVVGAVILSLVAYEGAASAETPARALAGSELILDADRLMPLLNYESITVTDPNNSSASATASVFSIAVLTSGPQIATLYTLPRLGADFGVGQGVTLGLSAWIYTGLSESLSFKTQAGGQTSSNNQDLPKTTYWGVAPRLGYIVPVADTVALWPRAGIEYHKQNSSTVTTQSGTISQTSGGQQEYQLAADIEGALVYTPVPHLGVTLTAYGAIPIVGGVSGVTALIGTQPVQSRASFDMSQLSVGLTLGLLGYL